MSQTDLNLPNLRPCEACLFAPIKIATATLALVRGELGGLGLTIAVDPAAQGKIDAAIGAVLDSIAARLDGVAARLDVVFDEVPEPQISPGARRQRRYRERLKALVTPTPAK